MKAFIAMLLLLAAARHTQTPQSKTLHFGSFQLTTPSDWQKLSRPGIDSYTGGLTNGQDTLLPPPKQFFNTNCTSCHHLFKTSTEPALLQVIPLRSSSSWVHTYLTNRQQLPQDTLTEKLVKQYQMSCFRFPHLTRQETENIYQYIL